MDFVLRLAIVITNCTPRRCQSQISADLQKMSSKPLLSPFWLNFIGPRESETFRATCLNVAHLNERKWRRRRQQKQQSKNAPVNEFTSFVRLIQNERIYNCHRRYASEPDDSFYGFFSIQLFDTISACLKFLWKFFLVYLTESSTLPAKWINVYFQRQVYCKHLTSFLLLNLFLSPSSSLCEWVSVKHQS